ncbi:MAG: hypothetical protein GIW99_09195 [Candidatus Eremiobacteraeota bacterium]|nr:hypothetical protein [Candidatus Eremiobacteraeota bacterium]MBC5827839.1 hypothetical protein [Candidatus Eremiobacteraeota bacterium]
MPDPPKVLPANFFDDAPSSAPSTPPPAGPKPPAVLPPNFNGFDKQPPSSATPSWMQRVGGAINQFKPLAPFSRAVAGTGSNLMGFVDRGRKALQSEAAQQPDSPLSLHSGHSLHDIGTALAGNETPAQDEANQKAILAKLGLPDDKLTRFLINTGLDPTVSGGGLSKLGFDLAERHGLPLALKATDKLSETNAVRSGAEKLHDYFGVDSATKRELARDQNAGGPNWLDQYMGLYGQRSAAESSAARAQSTLTNQFEQLVKSTPDADRKEAYKAIHYGKPLEELSPAARRFAQAHVDMTRGMYATEANRRGQVLVGYKKSTKEIADAKKAAAAPPAPQDEGGFPAAVGKQARPTFELPDYMKPFASDRPRNLATSTQFRAKYVPGITAITPAEREAWVRKWGEQRVQALESSMLGRKAADPFYRPRNDELPTAMFDDPTLGDEAMRARIKAWAKAISEHDAQRDVMKQYGAKRLSALPSDVRGFFSKKYVSQDEKASVDPGAPIRELLKGGVDWGKGGMFSLPFRHVSNMGNLLSMAAPSAIPGAIKHYAETALMKPEDRYAHYAPQISAGAIQTALGDRDSAFTGSLLKGGQKVSVANVPAVMKPLTKAGGAALTGAGKWYRNSADQLWKAGDAMAAGLFDHYVKHGMSPREAAYQTITRMVDYTHRSPFAEDVSTIFPFATWDTKMPLAAGRSLLSNPGAMATLNRLHPALSGAQADNLGDPQKATAASLPSSELLDYAQVAPKLAGYLGGHREDLGDIKKWFRGRLNDPGRLFMNVVAGDKHDPNWWTYGETAPGYVLRRLPLVGQAMDYTGHGMFRTPGLTSLAASQTGFYPTFKQRPASAKAAFIERYLSEHPDKTEYDATRMLQVLHRYTR